MADRKERLEEHGRAFARLRFAVAWTEGVEGDSAKRVVTKGWQGTLPLHHSEDFNAGLFAQRGEQRNPVVVARPSGLILVECDSAEDVSHFGRYVEQKTLVAQSSGPQRLHFYFKAPESGLEFAGFRFEAGNVRAVTNMYLVAPPAMHPSGVEYKFITDFEDLSTLSMVNYEALCHLAGESSQKVTRELQDPEAKVSPGNRRDFIFRYACSQRRYGTDYETTVSHAHLLNAQRCDPPLYPAHVVTQVRGAYDRYEPEVFDSNGPPGRHYESLDLFQKVPPVDWVVENLVVGNETTLLVGDGGQGKSFFALAMALAVAGDEDRFLDCAIRSHGRVVYVDEEGSPDLALQRMEQLGATAEQKANIDYLCGAGVDLIKEPHKLLEDVKALEPVLVILDSHSRVTRAGEENSPNEMARAWTDGIIPLARETGAAVFVIHHTNKEGRQPRGTTQIRNSADQVLTMDRLETGQQKVWASKPRRITEAVVFNFEHLPGGHYRLVAPKKPIISGELARVAQAFYGGYEPYVDAGLVG